MTANFDFGDDIAVSDIEITDENFATATIAVAGNASTGARDLVVTVGTTEYRLEYALFIERDTTNIARMLGVFPAIYDATAQTGTVNIDYDTDIVGVPTAEIFSEGGTNTPVVENISVSGSQLSVSLSNVVSGQEYELIFSKLAFDGKTADDRVRPVFRFFDANADYDDRELPPIVVRTEPREDTGNLPVADTTGTGFSVHVFFDQALDTDSLSDETVQLFDETGREVSGSFSYATGATGPGIDGREYRLTYRTNGPLTYARGYELRLSHAIKNDA